MFTDVLVTFTEDNNLVYLFLDPDIILIVFCILNIE